MELRLPDLDEEAAIVTDRYLDALIASSERGASDAPSDALLHPSLRRAARWLHGDLIRVHPSFRFEERLSARLAAAAQGSSLAAGAEGTVVPIAPTGSAIDWATFDPLADPAEHTLDWPGLSRPILIGGAVASAALSVAGAALMAWRLTRGETDPMSRAVRAVNRLRSDASRARPA
jgi:hypothetical protein